MSLELSNQIKKDSFLTSGPLSFRCLNDISLPTGLELTVPIIVLLLTPTYAIKVLEPLGYSALRQN